MKTLLASAAVALLSNCAKDLPPIYQNKQEVRVTYYRPDHIWGDAVACQTTMKTQKRAKKGVTVAADPKVFPYGTKVFIPDLKGVIGDGHFIVQDTGPAVKRRTASKRRGEDGKKLPVIDVFVKNQAEVNRYKKQKEYMEIYTK